MGPNSSLVFFCWAVSWTRPRAGRGGKGLVEGRRDEKTREESLFSPDEPSLAAARSQSAAPVSRRVPSPHLFGAPFLSFGFSIRLRVRGNGVQQSANKCIRTFLSLSRANFSFEKEFSSRERFNNIEYREYRSRVFLYFNEYLDPSIGFWTNW